MQRGIYRKTKKFLINRLGNKQGYKYKICNESNPEYKIFNPEMDAF